MFEEIQKPVRWTRIEQVNKGWSDDRKFYIETEDRQRLLLRTSSIERYEQKKQEYAMIGKYSTLGFGMSRPVRFGTLPNQGICYMLLTWVDGQDLELALPKLEPQEQYRLGREAGEILNSIHSLEAPADEFSAEAQKSKKKMQLQKYMDSAVRIQGDERAIELFNRNIHKICAKPPVYQHGDFHPGNLILTPGRHIGVIDFNRAEIGDPYEEFYKLESFGTEVSLPYCLGQMDAYFKDAVPEEFWEVHAVYVAHAALYSIKWAEKFGSADVENMIRIGRKIFAHYDNFNSSVPNWYSQAGRDFEA